MQQEYKYRFPILLLIMICMLFYSCRSTREVTENGEFNRAELTVEQLIGSLPDYRESLKTIKGTGRVIVSEPGNNERATLEFFSNRNESLINVKTSVGIEGGQIYVDSDSLLIYNRVDKVADRLPLNQGNMSSVGSIASVNILDLFNFTIDETEVAGHYVEDDDYVVTMKNGARVQISKSSRRVQMVNQPIGTSDMPYSKIEYEGYAEIEDFFLPRKITVYSSDGKSRAILLVQRLEVNRDLPDLAIDLPDNITVNVR